jgi:hypothetical protein
VSNVDDIKRRMELANALKCSKLRAHLAAGQLGKAAQVADELGERLPRGVVVSLAQLRPRQ